MRSLFWLYPLIQFFEQSATISDSMLKSLESFLITSTYLGFSFVRKYTLWRILLLSVPQESFSHFVAVDPGNSALWSCCLPCRTLGSLKTYSDPFCQTFQHSCPKFHPGSCWPWPWRIFGSSAHPVLCYWQTYPGCNLYRRAGPWIWIFSFGNIPVYRVSIFAARFRVPDVILVHRVALSTGFIFDRAFFLFKFWLNLSLVITNLLNDSLVSINIDMSFIDHPCGISIIVPRIDNFCAFKIPDAPPEHPNAINLQDHLGLPRPKKLTQNKTYSFLCSTIKLSFLRITLSLWGTKYFLI